MKKINELIKNNLLLSFLLAMMSLWVIDYILTIAYSFLLAALDVNLNTNLLLIEFGFLIILILSIIITIKLDLGEFFLKKEPKLRSISITAIILYMIYFGIFPFNYLYIL